MSIDRTTAMKPINPVQSRETNEAVPQKTHQPKPPLSGSASVTLSDAQSALMHPGSGDINMERVEAMKTAIRNGELKMDTGKIADTLIFETQRYLQDK